jgi:arylsulfatase A-like enzyme
MYFFILPLFYASLTFCQEKPNIVFILADDLGYGDLGVHNEKDVKTPNIDALTQKGTFFYKCRCR